MASWKWLDPGGRLYDTDELIPLLKERGTSDGNINVLRVADAIRGPCKPCGANGWPS